MLAFDERGLLPPGDYPMTFDDIRNSVLVKGPPNARELHWDSKWRLTLVSNCEIMVRQLWQVGVEDIFIDGSFVEMKPRPNDIDGYFVVDVYSVATGDLQTALNRLDPYKIWVWDRDSRRPHKGSTKKQLPMWHQYRVELYPHYKWPAHLNRSGILDRNGQEMQLPAAFRTQRDTYEPKGIVKILRP